MFQTMHIFVMQKHVFNIKMETKFGLFELLQMEKKLHTYNNIICQDVEKSISSLPELEASCTGQWIAKKSLQQVE